MTEKPAYPPGVPCWVDTLQPDPRRAVAFYGSLFGWDGIGPGPMAGGEYFVARLHGDDVAGIATLPPGGIAEPAWTTYVRVAKAGGTVIAPPSDAGNFRRAAIACPAGAVFSISQLMLERREAIAGAR